MIRRNEGIIHTGRGDVNVTGPIGRHGKFIQHPTPRSDSSDRRAEGQNTVEKCDIAFLTAVPVETQSVFDELRQWGAHPRSIQRKGRYFDVFDLPSKGRVATRVVSTQATDKGGQSASAVTHDVLTGFQPQLVLLVGVCAGFDERKVSLFDLILARNIFNYDPERVQPNSTGTRPQVYRTDEQLLRLASYMHNRGDLNDVLQGADLHIKDYASGEKVIAWHQAALRARLLSLSTDLYGIETEAHGVMHAIWETFKADQFVGGGMIKCVSDLGDEEMSADKKVKQRKAAQKAARVALKLAAAFHR
jgi:nucleoside phosphorylase